MGFFKDKDFQFALSAFILLNILLYFFIIRFHNLVPFNKTNYTSNAHHFFEDPRINGGNFDLLDGLAQFDAQWYLKIAESGYPANPQDNYAKGNLGSWEIFVYAFFPLFPILISMVNFVISNLFVSAFIVSNILLITTFISLYYVIDRLYSKEIALKSSALLMLFPFSIFLRSYFTEGLFLMLFIWFSYNFTKNNYFYSSVFLALLTITRPTAIPLIPIFLFFLFKDHSKTKTSGIGLIALIIVSVTPLLLWSLFNYYQTGNESFFMSVQAGWYNKATLFKGLFVNIESLLTFFKLPFHSFHKSQIDILVAIFATLISIKGYKILPKKIWISTLVLLFVPLLLKDTMSYSRYTAVVFPVFIVLANMLNKRLFLILATIFLVLLFTTSLYFVNWWWIG